MVLTAAQLGQRAQTAKQPVGRQADVPVGSQREAEAPVRWETVPCPLCATRHRRVVVPAAAEPGAAGQPRPAVVRCLSCGLCYTSPRPTADSMGPFYPADYRPHRSVLSGCDGPGRSAAGRRPGTLLARSLRAWAGRIRSAAGRDNPRKRMAPFGGARLLDFGCGSGSYLKRMHGQGWQELGLDTSQKAIDRLRGELRLPAVVGTLPHPALAPASFEVVTMWQSLEHVHRPLEVLREAYRLLVPGGRLIVAVPNIDSAPFRWFGEHWFPLELPRHLVHFSPGTLTEMVRRAGFQVLWLRMSWHSSWLRASARLARARGRTRWWLRLLDCRPVCRLLGWYCLLAGRSDSMVLSAVKPAAGS